MDESCTERAGQDGLSLSPHVDHISGAVKEGPEGEAAEELRSQVGCAHLTWQFMAIGQGSQTASFGSKPWDGLRSGLNVQMDAEKKVVRRVANWSLIVCMQRNNSSKMHQS